jgi:hypothetical protein
VLASSLGRRHVAELGATTLQQDEELLGSGTLGHKAVVAVRFRMALKRALASAPAA